jgi:DNA-directed RNA polymerase specialized sigma24 family protein
VINDDIYQDTLPPYKRKRLFFSLYFRTLYSGEVEPKISLNQYLYRIATHCWLQRLREEDILTVFGWWYKKHGIQPNFGYLRHVVIPETYEHTTATVRAQRKEENARAKAKRLARKLLCAIGGQCQ